MNYTKYCLCKMYEYLNAEDDFFSPWADIDWTICKKFVDLNKRWPVRAMQ